MDIGIYPANSIHRRPSALLAGRVEAGSTPGGVLFVPPGLVGGNSTSPLTTAGTRAIAANTTTTTTTTTTTNAFSGSNSGSPLKMTASLLGSAIGDENCSSAGNSPSPNAKSGRKRHPDDDDGNAPVAPSLKSSPPSISPAVSISNGRKSHNVSRISPDAHVSKLHRKMTSGEAEDPQTSTPIETISVGVAMVSKKEEDSVSAKQEEELIAPPQQDEQVTKIRHAEQPTRGTSSSLLTTRSASIYPIVPPRTQLLPPHQIHRVSNKASMTIHATSSPLDVVVIGTSHSGGDMVVSKFTGIPCDEHNNDVVCTVVQAPSSVGTAASHVCMRVSYIKRASQLTQDKFTRACTALVVVDATNFHQSLREAVAWKKEIEAAAFFLRSRVPTLILVANKGDAACIGHEEGMRESSEKSGFAAFFLASALTGKNVADAFACALRMGTDSDVQVQTTRGVNAVENTISPSVSRPALKRRPSGLGSILQKTRSSATLETNGGESGKCEIS